MNKIRISLMTLALLCCSTAFSQQQSNLQQMLKQMLKSSPQMQAEKAKFEAAQKQAKTNLWPAGPEFEMRDYRSGQNNDSRIEYGVMQSFIFPTFYSRQLKQANLQEQLAVKQFQQSRQQFVSQSLQLFHQLYFNQQKLLMVEEHLSHAEELLSLIKTAVESGELTRIDLNKAQLNKQKYSLEKSLLLQQQNQILSKLINQSGNTLQAGDFLQLEFRLDTANLEQIRNQPQLYSADYQLAELQAQMAQSNINLQRNNALPQLRIGYGSELEGQTRFSGLRFGMQIPLWANHNQVKTAKLQAVYRQQNSQAQLSALQAQTNSLWLNYNSLCEQLKQVLSESQTILSPDELLQAFQAGTLSLTELYTDLLFRHEYKVLSLQIQQQQQLMLLQISSAYIEQQL